MNGTATKEYVRVRKDEYRHLKKLQRYVDPLLGYLEHVRNIRIAREDVVAGRTVTQEQLFRKLGM